MWTSWALIFHLKPVFEHSWTVFGILLLALTQVNIWFDFLQDTRWIVWWSEDVTKERKLRERRETDKRWAVSNASKKLHRLPTDVHALPTPLVYSGQKRKLVALNWQNPPSCTSKIQFNQKKIVNVCSQHCNF
jgi:hypothetical protein